MIISLFLLMTIAMFFSSCASQRKNSRSLESLMLQDNTKLRINRAYYSHHNIKTRKDAYRKYRKYGRR